MEQILTDHISFFIECFHSDIVIEIHIKEEWEAKHTIDIDDNEFEHCCHQQLIFVDGDGLNHITQGGETVLNFINDTDFLQWYP